MNDPTISIIVPVYNVEKYIHRCIDSILAQTFTDFELILVDDGSPDNCPAICDEYAKKDSRVRVIHKPNGGVSSARNAGVDAARGEYVAFVDSDDWITFNCMEKMVAACEENHADMVLCGYVFATDKAAESPKTAAQNVILTGREAVDFYGKENILNNTCHFRAPWAKMIRRSIVASVPFPLDRIYAEDAACIYLWMWQAKKVVGIADELYYYFQNPGGICARPMGLYAVGNFLTEQEWISFFSQNGLTELRAIACKRYLDDCLWAINGSIRANDTKAEKEYRRILRRALPRYSHLAGVRLLRQRKYLYALYPQMGKLTAKIKKIVKRG